MNSWAKQKSLIVTTLVVCLCACTTAFAKPDEDRMKKGQAAIDKAVNYLKSKQAENGSWVPHYGPAITALAARGILKETPKGSTDPAAEKAIKYILGKAQPDGGIYDKDGSLQNYNTSICLATLGLIADRPDVKPVIKRAQDYLRGLQWSNQNDPAGKPITEAHPFYGGAGYGNHGRPDMSNTHFMVEGLKESGLSADDPAFQRALVFIGRCQATDVNAAPWRDRLSNDGGFIYATSENKDKIGVPQSMAGEEVVEMPGRGKVPVLRSYGSMTYAGFKSYAYAKLDKNDPRVVAARQWVVNNYTLDQNPGWQDNPKTESDERLSGYFYYLMTFARALEAWNESTLELPDNTKANWANDLIDKLSSIQQPDGSWTNSHDRWLEGDPVLTTAYSVIALQAAMGK